MSMSYVNLSSHQDFVDVIKPYLPLAQLAVGFAAASGNLTTKEIKNLAEETRAACDVIENFEADPNDSHGTGSEIRTLKDARWAITEVAIQQYYPECPEKREAMSNISTAAVNTWGMT